MNKASTTNIFYLKKTTSSECDNNKQFGISREVLREFFDVPDVGNTNVEFIGVQSHVNFTAEIQTATDPRLGQAGIREFFSKEGGVSTGDYILFNKLSYRVFSVSIIKQGTEDYKSYSKLFLTNNDKHAGFFTESYDEQKINETSPSTHPSQIIYYGVLGSGKSHKIDEITKNVPDEQKMRVVFHPEYTNADFVGQIVPRVDDGVDYRFKAGPFSRILKRAYQNIDKPFYLIIEEINRGNASAIFGDLFQLLDRDESGYSKYSVENLDINSYIRSKDNLYNDKEVPSTVKVGDTEWTEITGIRLPPNLSIFATMNTSDQNVFALDNAFQRRWDMELVPNTCDDKIQMNALIENTSYTWGQFQATINSIISEKSNSTELSSMEDKRLGCWFVKACEYESENKEKKFGISKKIFANKVLKYLWDDAFKFCHQEIFLAEIFDFENLQNIFYKRGFGIFSEESGIVNILNSLQSSDTTTQTPAEEASGN